MKGKKASAAANRHDREELERRATTAEHTANRLTGEVAELKQRAETEIQALRTALADARKLRDQGASPALAEAEERIRSLRAVAEDDAAKYDELQRSYGRQFDHFVSFLRTTGLSNIEAMEVAMAGVLGRTVSLVAESSGVASQHAGGGSGEMIRRVQAAKGFRAAPLLSHHVAEKILAATREQEQAEADAAEAERKSKAALLGAAVLHSTSVPLPLGEEQ